MHAAASDSKKNVLVADTGMDHDRRGSARCCPNFELPRRFVSVGQGGGKTKKCDYCKNEASKLHVCNNSNCRLKSLKKLIIFITNKFNRSKGLKDRKQGSNMKKSLFAIACAALVSASTAFAEGGMFEGYLPEDWKENGKADVVAAIKYTRMDFHNWKQESGTSSSTWLVTYDADLKIPFSILDWSSKINLAIGQTWTDGFGRRKSSDKIFVETMADFRAFPLFKPYVGARFESQFMRGYVYSEDDDGNEIKTTVSHFMAPGYVTQMAGIGYFPNENFSTRLGFANRMTIVADDSDTYTYADDPDTKKIEKFKDEPGLESITEFKYNYSDLVTFKSRLWAFINFKGFDEIDGKWENILAVTISPLFEIQIGYDIAYDKDLDKDSQHKNMFLVGMTWRWF